MGKIQSNIGLVTGLDIGGTVDKLISIAARPRDLLKQLNDKRQAQQLAYAGLSAQILSLQLAVRRFQNLSLYDQRSATSSASNLLSVKTSGKPALGSYQFTPLQLAQAQRLVSTGFSSKDTALPAGSFSFGFGGFIDPDTNLDVLNGGAGLARGRFRITDRSGASATVDLSQARTVADVLQAINTAAGINVQAEVHDDRLRLVDRTGSTTGNLRVDEVGGGTTAASLGLADINLAASQADGTSVLRLFAGLKLDQLNGGTGIRLDEALNDLRFTFRDGSSPLDVDFRRLGTSASLIVATTAGLGRTDAQVTFTAVQARPELVGTQIKFVNDDTLRRGNETVAYDAQAKSLTIKIDQGNTSASDVVAALGRNSAVAALFSARLVPGSSGSGLVIEEDGVMLDGPKSTAVTTAAQGASAVVSLTARASDPALDGYRLTFVDDPDVTQGSEFVVLDNQAKTITVRIDAGSSTAVDVVTALNADVGFAASFTATLGAGSSGTGLVDVADAAITAGGTVITAGTETTLGDLLTTLNAADPTRLQAAISTDGQRIELTDLTADSGGTFSVAQLNGSKAVDDLGFNTATGGVIVGRRVLAGLGTSLLANLGGSAGLGALGQIALTDRSGATATVDLSTADTVQDILDSINAAGLGVRAHVNAGRNGIQLDDTTGQTVSDLVVANADGTQAADKLGLTYSGSSTTINGGNLRLRTVSENTVLASLNGGAGVAKGSLSIQDTNGVTRTFNLGQTGIDTLGDVLRELNGAGLSIQARINEAGDGLVVIDTAHGLNELKVTEAGATTAADLGLLRTAVTRDVSGTPTALIDGSFRDVITLTGSETLTDLVDRINTVSRGRVTATLVNDGSSLSPYKLSLLSSRTGRSGELQIDASELDIIFHQAQAAQDALVLVGSTDGGQIVASATNSFSQLADGLSLTVVGTSTTAITVTVSKGDDTLVSAAQDLVTRYNQVQEQLQTLSAADGTLAGDPTLARLSAQLAKAIGSRVLGGSITVSDNLGLGLYSPGIDTQSGRLVDADLGKLGTLVFDVDKFRAAFTADPEAVKSFFTAKEFGFSAVVDRTLERIAGAENSLLVGRIESLNRQIATGADRLEVLNQRLESQRTLLLNQFYQSEVLIGKLQNSLTYLASVQPLVVDFSSSNNSN